jgi:antitoxin component YwqK of YwqJK toxin-antitoxin module
MRKIILAASFLLILISCKKDNPLYTPVVENTDIPLISMVLIGGEVFSEFTYNEFNLVSEEKSKFHYTRHTYNENNQLILTEAYWDLSMASSNSAVVEAGMNRTEWVNPENTPLSITHELIYNGGGEVTRKNYIRTGDVNSDYVEFLYENDRIVMESGYSNDILRGYSELFYDDRGNLVKKLRYDVPESGIAQLNTTTEYELDFNPNPFQAFKRLVTPGIYTNANNIIKETTTIHNETDPNIRIQVVENSFEYDSDGYPIKLNGITEYIYQ